jgi:hypothetical protein
VPPGSLAITSALRRSTEASAPTPRPGIAIAACSASGATREAGGQRLPQPAVHPPRSRGRARRTGRRRPRPSSASLGQARASCSRRRTPDGRAPVSLRKGSQHPRAGTRGSRRPEEPPRPISLRRSAPRPRSGPDPLEVGSGKGAGRVVELRSRPSLYSTAGPPPARRVRQAHELEVHVQERRLYRQMRTPGAPTCSPVNAASTPRRCAIVRRSSRTDAGPGGDHEVRSLYPSIVRDR